MFKIWPYLSLIMFVMGWFEKASKDGKIDAAEIAEAAMGFSYQFGYQFTPMEIQTLISMLSKVIGKEISISVDPME